MPKPELEFTKITFFQASSSHNGTLTTRVLSQDPSTGDNTKLLTHAPGSSWGGTEDDNDAVCKHDYWEECYIVKGRLYDVGKKQWFEAGSYCCRPPGMLHGPYKADAELGCEEIAWCRW